MRIAPAANAVPNLLESPVAQTILNVATPLCIVAQPLRSMSPPIKKTTRFALLTIAITAGVLSLLYPISKAVTSYSSNFSFNLLPLSDCNPGLLQRANAIASSTSNLGKMLALQQTVFGPLTCDNYLKRNSYTATPYDEIDVEAVVTPYAWALVDLTGVGPTGVVEDTGIVVNKAKCCNSIACKIGTITYLITNAYNNTYDFGNYVFQPLSKRDEPYFNVNRLSAYLQKPWMIDFTNNTMEWYTRQDNAWKERYNATFPAIADFLNGKNFSYYVYKYFDVTTIEFTTIKIVV